MHPTQENNPVVSNSEAAVEQGGSGNQALKVTASVVSALRDGDHAAYKTVYIHYRKPVERFVLKLTGQQDTAADLAQEIFLNLWEQRERLDPSKNIGAYLYRIARNKVISSIYNKKELTERYSDAYEETILDSRGAIDDMEATETQLLVDIAVANMPKQRREVYNLYINKGYSNEEIARELNITPQNAKQHLFLARRDIQELLRLIAFFLMIP